MPRPESNRNVPTLVVALLTAALSPAAPLRAQDAVQLASGSGRVTVHGTVTDYHGGEIIIELPTGRTSHYPTDRVLQIDTEYSAAHQEADRLLDDDNFSAATPRFRAALEEESRTWVRRKIIAGLVTCHREMGDISRAGEFFLVLARSDPESPYLDCIPLAWMAGQTSIELERSARAWFQQKEIPAAVLLGASHLLTTPLEPQATLQLRDLSHTATPKIAALAETQLWRTRLNRVRPEELHSWQQEVARLPEPLRAGPSYLVGRAFANQQQFDQAAVAFLRIPYLHSTHRDLAAHAFFEAGTNLGKAGHDAEATRVLRELIETNPDHQAANFAIRYLEDARGDSADN